MTPRPRPSTTPTDTGERPGGGLRLGDRARRLRRLATDTAGRAWTDRILGLAAEAGFWALLSLTPLLLVLVAAIGYLTPLFGPGTAGQVEAWILTAAGHVLAPSAVEEVIGPVLADVLRHGRGEFVSVGFLLALWSGSAAMNTYVNAITIAYGMNGLRSALRSRSLAFALYLGALGAGAVVLPLLVASPGWILAAAPAAARPVVGPLVGVGYWPLLVVLCTGLLVVLYRAATPIRGRWRRDVPGAVLAMLLWLGGSLALRWVLAAAVSDNAAYGVLAAPAAALLFLYVTALAVLLGAELNAQAARSSADG
ncbi:YihY/virulence factor BrkB family protein [Nocardiopsis chromatogenes]|uniref:YihY/virulence factor BrkB family protein n=1 Tax=Nocardiopsis chromatogenes TaxID=280239 RepID=UPI00034C67BA|nr:YhjD/YihY/BrkB family envelope integrity protein [Nocardiopsis chromatogenes]